MKAFLILPGSRVWLAAIVGLSLLVIGYCVFLEMRRPAPPPVPIVSTCRQIGTGIRRIGGAYGFQFDVPEEDFRIHEGAQDAPPFASGFDITPKKKGSSSHLDISCDAEIGKIGRVPTPPGLAFSGSVEKQAVFDAKGHRIGERQNRVIFDDKGHRIGEDEWGYTAAGDRWRRIYLMGRICATYGYLPLQEDVPSYLMRDSAHKQDAEMFDRIIDSVCFAPPTSHSD